MSLRTMARLGWLAGLSLVLGIIIVIFVRHRFLVKVESQADLVVSECWLSDYLPEPWVASIYGCEELHFRDQTDLRLIWNAVSIMRPKLLILGSQNLNTDPPKISLSYCRIDLISFEGCIIEEQYMQWINSQTNLKHLDLVECQVADIDPLLSFKSLETLVLYESEETTRAVPLNLNNLSQLPLRTLVLNCPITDSDCLAIARISTLKTVLLRETDITDKGFQHLLDSKNISEISIESPELTVAVFERIGNCPRNINFEFDETEFDEDEEYRKHRHLLKTGDMNSIPEDPY